MPNKKIGFLIKQVFYLHEQHLNKQFSKFGLTASQTFTLIYLFKSHDKGISVNQKDIEKGIISKQEALEILECLWLKFNQIVYLRNQHSAKYFAGFPIGFNIAIGGIDENGCDIYNELSLLLLKAQYHLGLPQPNLSVRLNKNSSHELIQEAIKVVAKGSGMPQFFNDEAIVNSMIKDLGIEESGLDKLIKEAYSLLGLRTYFTAGVQEVRV